jgi:hypothetical protein
VDILKDCHSHKMGRHLRHLTPSPPPAADAAEICTELLAVADAVRALAAEAVVGAEAGVCRHLMSSTHAVTAAGGGHVSVGGGGSSGGGGRG